MTATMVHATKERSIICSAEEVRAFLDGRKSQIRFVMKNVPSDADGPFERAMAPGSGQSANQWAMKIAGKYIRILCPLGKPGDRLWCKESFQPLFAGGFNGKTADWKTGKGYKPSYPATDGRKEFLDSNSDSISDRIWPSTHMPRWASRLTLEIESIRAQRLQEISEEEAKAEGVEPYSMTQQDIDDLQISDRPPLEKELGRLMGPGSFSHKVTYQMLWDELNKKSGHGWDKNEWVWAVSLRSVNDNS
jgi:hypothetical protein